MLFIDEFRMTTPAVEQLIQNRLAESSKQYEINQLAKSITEQLVKK